jgi:GH24 family phage-related lysozyme (muramidase)
MTRLEKLLIKHEGYQNKAYEDTVGTVSIGVGRNLDDRWVV